MPRTPAPITRPTQMRTHADLVALLPRAKPVRWYRPGRRVVVADKMQRRYAYTLTARYGRDFDPEFRPELTPAQMLRRGVFEGKYLNDCVFELPREWYAGALARLSPERADATLNEFGVKSRKSLRYWRGKGWIPVAPGGRDVRGWFQWYARYYIGRRDPAVDERQIMRWKLFRRHAGQIRADYRRLGRRRPRTKRQKRAHRARQRQALLQWAYDPYV
jgi:hypothetical protein